MALIDEIGLVFTPDLVKASLMLTLTISAVAVGLFAFVGHRAERSACRLWTIGWLFYLGFVGSMIVVEFVDHEFPLAMIPTACVALSGLFMFAGNLEAVDRPLSRRNVTLGAISLVGFNYFAHTNGFVNWFSCSAYWALAAAALFASRLFYRSRKATTGAYLVGLGYSVWAMQVVVVPLIESSPTLFGVSQFVASACLLAVAVNVLVNHQVDGAEQKYRALLDGTSDVLFMVDLWSLKVLDANQAAVRFARRSLAEVIGISFPELCPDLRQHGQVTTDHRSMFANVFKPCNEFHFVRVDNSMVLCEGETTLSQWQGRPIVQVRMHEVNGDRNVSQLVRRAEKMSSLGQMIAGVAHELNNPLAVVVASAQMLAKEPREDERLHANVHRILHETTRAARIVRDLLSFARPSEPQFAVVNLNELVNNVLEVRQRDLEGQGVALVKHLAPKLSDTKVDPIQIEQVLNNLITNAAQAMAGRTNPHVLTVFTEEGGLFQHIIISDTGCGMPAEVIQKIYEPFFTTKAPGKGTGLGLAISHNILQEHHGRIWVESEVGKGTTFHLELPLVPCGAPVLAPVTAAEKEALLFANQSRRLLVVDDEPGIRDVFEAILGGCGYNVNCVANGVEALEYIRAGKFDLIIADLCMPEMDGEELYETIHEFDAALAKRMIFVTGDTVGAKSRSFLERSGCRWLSKPFNIRDVEEVVDQYLREHLPTNGVTSTVEINSMLN